MQTAKYWIEKLGLQKHPEGGWFKEVYRSEDVCENESEEERNCSTSIYYLLEGEDFSSFHRIKSDELWHFYTGTSGVEILWIDEMQIKTEKLGPNLELDQHFQIAIPKNKWFAARLSNTNGFALVGCTVSPGFHFDDFELADRNLTKKYPEISDKIDSLIRN